MRQPPRPTEPHATQPMLFCGIDVSQAALAVAVQPHDHPVEPVEQREFANSAAGHKALIAWLGRRKLPVRVSLEATGIYSLDLALALDRAPGIELAVLNPKTANRFAQSLSHRSKTDRADALALAEYSRRMPFTPWRAPNPQALRLRALTRHIATLTEQSAREQNRLHAAQASAETPRLMLADLRRSLAALHKRILRLRRDALAQLRAGDALRQRFELMTSIPGIAQTSALHLIGELAALPPELSVRQWVASSGLDPAHHDSGTSVHRRARISRHGNRHLRRALYMPALVATRHDPHLKAFYDTLLARHKARMQALIAVARKLLHAIYGIFKTLTPYDGAKLFPNLSIHPS